MDRYTWGGVKVFFENMGACNVTLFLALSGYGLAASWEKDSHMKNYWRNKLEKIYFPYALITIVYMLACFTKPLPGKIVLLNILCINMNKIYTLDSTMWFLTFLLFWYLIFFVVMKQQIRIYFKLFVLWAIGICFSSLWEVPEEVAWFAQVIRWSALGFPLGVMSFFVGKLIEIKIEKARYKKIILLFIAGAALSIFFYIYYLYPFTDFLYEVTGILWTIGIVSIFRLSKEYRKPSFLSTNIKKIFGLIPYLIYLLENKVLQYSIQKQFNIWQYLTILVGSAVFFSYIICKLQQYKIEENID